MHINLLSLKKRSFWTNCRKSQLCYDYYESLRKVRIRSTRSKAFESWFRVCIPFVLFFSNIYLLSMVIYISKPILGRKICNELKKTYNVQNKKTPEIFLRWVLNVSIHFKHISYFRVLVLSTKSYKMGPKVKTVISFQNISYIKQNFIQIF